MKKKAIVERDCVGIVIARFQVPYLHEAHKELIDYVSERHDKVVIFLGISSGKATKANPLDFEARKQMVLEAYPDVTVLYVKDQRNDDDWSADLDERIEDCLDALAAGCTAKLYGGRNSFIRHYTGRYAVEELESDVYVSGTEIRKGLGGRAKNDKMFRAGAIWASFQRWPMSIHTVDIAVIDFTKNRLLLGRKKKEDRFRFIGGFTTPTAKSDEDDALRELREEAGSIEVGKLVYVCSLNIDDWRYRNEEDKIRTTLYIAPYIYGGAKAGDDIHEVRWFDLATVGESELMPEHGPLLVALKESDALKDLMADRAYRTEV